MESIECPECGKEVSSKAINCPNCGYPINLEKTILSNNVFSQMNQSFKLIHKIIVILIFAVIIFTGFITLRGSIIKNNQYDKAAQDSARNVLEDEVENYTWTNVKTGELEYKCTLFNESLGKYRVYYFAKFDIADESEDSFLEIVVELIGEELLVSDTSCIYWSAEDYELEKERMWGTIEDKDGKWVNVEQVN